MENPEQTLENKPEAIVKERKKPNITPEDRAQRAERMREMATKRNELLRKQNAERFNKENKGNQGSLSNPPLEEEGVKGKVVPTSKPKTPRVKKGNPPLDEVGVRENVVPPPAQVLTKEEKATPKPVKKAVVKKPVKVKTLVIQSSSDSEDYCDGNTTCESESETEEVVYIAKTAKNKTKSKLTKAKPSRTPDIPVREPMTQKPDPIKIKFF